MMMSPLVLLMKVMSGPGSELQVENCLTEFWDAVVDLLAQQPIALGQKKYLCNLQHLNSLSKTNSGLIMKWIIVDICCNEIYFLAYGYSF